MGRIVAAREVVSKIVSSSYVRMEKGLTSIYSLQ